MTADLVRAANQADPNAFIDVARSQLGGRTLTDHAIALASAGRTTVSEVIKVATQMED